MGGDWRRRLTIAVAWPERRSRLPCCWRNSGAGSGSAGDSLRGTAGAGPWDGTRRGWWFQRGTGCQGWCVVRPFDLRDSPDGVGVAARDPRSVTNVLVAYASKRGSSAEIAEAIAESLRQSGLSVDCVEAGEVSSVASYDAVVLGSAVYIKRWRGDAKRFLRKHDKELSQRPLWEFSSGPVGDPASEADLYVRHRHQLRSPRAAMSEGYSTRPPVWTWPEWGKAKPGARVRQNVHRPNRLVRSAEQGPQQRRDHRLGRRRLRRHPLAPHQPRSRPDSDRGAAMKTASRWQSVSRFEIRLCRPSHRKEGQDVPHE